MSDAATSPARLPPQIGRRRTFAIISHPDAGKTTLTEKLLLFGGAINLAGEVKARGERRRATSDWMKIERERGISVTASVMTYEYRDWTFNLLDTPGHEDFSEDTYRTLTAVDSAIMVIDAAKGIEAQTRKLFEVCRLRDIPIITYVNKMDREARDPFELLDEIEQTLALDVSPVTWPIGMGDRFRGCFDLRNDQLVLLDRKNKGVLAEGTEINGLDDPGLDEHLGDGQADTLRDEVETVRGLCPEFDLESFRAGALTPVFFGSALWNFGVRELLDGVAELAPPPRPQPANREVAPGEKKMTGFVFKIQANMDPKHRDRIAFFRLCSGQFKRGMKLHHARSGKTMAVNNAVLFQARDRELAEEAWAGDIIGIPNHGTLHIGDALTEGEDLKFTGIPMFAPELLQKVRPLDPMRAKHLGKALTHMAEEGAAQAFRTYLGSEWVIGVVGSLQFDVLSDRIKNEYNLPVRFETTSYVTARWVRGDDAELKLFAEKNPSNAAEDHRGQTVFLPRNDWHLDRTVEDWPNLEFLKTIS